MRLVHCAAAKAARLRKTVPAQTAAKLEQVSNMKLLVELWLDASPDPLIWIDLNGTISAANRAAAELAGRNVESLVGTPVITLASEPSPKRLQKGMARLWLNAAGEVYTVLMPLRIGLEPKRYVRLRVLGMRDGVKRLLAVSVTDVTELIQARRQARRIAVANKPVAAQPPVDTAVEPKAAPAPAPASKERVFKPAVPAAQSSTHESFLRTLADHMTDVVAVYDNTGHIRYISPSVERLFGYEPVELYGRASEWMFDPADRAEVAKAVAEIKNAPSNTAKRIEARARDAQGATRYVQVDLVNLPDVAPINGVLMSMRNIDGEYTARQAVAISERRFAALTKHMHEIISVLDAQGTVRYISPALQRLLGFSPEEVVGQHYRMLVPQEIHAMLDEQHRELIEHKITDPGVPVEHEMLAKNGTRRLFASIGRNCINDPAVEGIIISSRDITEVSRIGQRPAENIQHARYRETLVELAVAPKSDWAESLKNLLSAAGNTLGVSRASFWRMHNNPRRLECEAMYLGADKGFDASWVKRPFTEADQPAYFQWLSDNRPIITSNPEQHLATVGYADAEGFKNVTALIDVPVWIEGSPVGLVCFEVLDVPREWSAEDESFATHVASLLALALEGALLREAEKRIERLAWLDSLTGLPNRNLLKERLTKLLDKVGKKGSRAAVLLLDLDRFKEVNDTYGHHVGDALLKNTAQALHKTVGQQGWVARLGGDEFVVVVPTFTHRDDLAKLATAIGQGLAKAEIPKGIEFSVTPSIGIAVYPEHGRSISSLLKHADAAMYQAKASGRATFQFYNAFRHNIETREVRAAKQLQKALDSREIELHYQPQVDIKTRKTVGMEALVRWQHPERGLLMPEAFLGLIEEFQMSEALTRYVTHAACRQIEAWRGMGIEVPQIAINITGREFCDLRLPTIIRQALNEYGLPANVLAAEITEGSLVHDNEVAVEVFKSLAQTGVHISLDDFGMGYSSLNYLKRLPIDSIKIDRSFIENLPFDADSAAITQAIISMAQHLNLDIVAEGVERANQAEYLLKLGCKIAQGYYYSPPLDVKGIEALLANQAAGVAAGY
jgi:diguanylate cyclase (GGDEF)-like protein/PAS domain S-box-containing protein